jgi:hypothetical protein
VLIIYVWCAALAVAGYTVRWAGGPFKVVALVALFVITGFMAYWLGLFEAVQHPEDSDAPKVREGRRHQTSK